MRLFTGFLCVSILCSCQTTPAPAKASPEASAPAAAGTPAAAKEAKANPNASVRVVEDGIEFSVKRPDAKKVFLAGSFNGWSPDNDAMTKGEDGVWRRVQKLEDGSYKYKFVIDGKWEHDAQNSKAVADGFGGKNSVLVIDEGKITTPAQ